MLSPADATKLREDNLSDKLSMVIKRQILEQLEKLMRKNPFGKTFSTVGELVEEAKNENDGWMPRFQVIINKFFILMLLIRLSYCLIENLMKTRFEVVAELNEDAIRSCNFLKCLILGM